MQEQVEDNFQSVGKKEEGVYPLFFLFLLSLSLFFSCKKQDSDKEIHQYITSHYSVEDINAFYERSFNNVGDTIIKLWNNPVKYYLTGDTIDGDAACIAQLMEQVNKIIPIHISRTYNTKEVNMLISFKPDSAMIERKGIHGITQTLSDGYLMCSDILQIKIELSNALRGKMRNAVLVHELFHGIGLSSHVTTDYRSIMYLEGSAVDDISKELQTLKILYEPIMCQCQTVADFERIFANELYHINSEEKLYNYLKTRESGTQLADTLYKYAFINLDSTLGDKIYKYMNGLPIYISGNAPKEIVDTLKQMLAEINTVTPYCQFIFNPDIVVFTGITLNFIKGKEKDSLPYYATYYCPYLEQKFRTYHKMVVNVGYNSINTPANKIGRFFYERLITKNKMGMDVLSKDIFEKRDGKYYLKPFYRELLEVYYSPHLPHNFTKSQMEKVIEMRH